MRRVLAALAVLLLAGTAHAFTISQVKLQPGFFTSGVRVFCTGVLDTTMALTCDLEIKQNRSYDARWNAGVRCFRRVGQTNAFDGIIIGLSQNTSYSVRTTVSNGSNGSDRKVQVFTTRYNDPAVKGPLVYISPSGDDGNPCTSASPCLTIAIAAAQLTQALDNYGRGGGIVLKPGIYAPELPYFGSNWSAGIRGTPDSLYHIMGDGTNPDSTIIDFSIAGSFTWVDGANLHGVGGGTGVWYVINPQLSGSAFSDSIGEVIRGWGDLYPKKLSWIELKGHINDVGGEIGLYNGVRGWWVNGTSPNDTLFVFPADSLTPGASLFHFSYSKFISRMPYLRFSNLTLRYVNGAIQPGYTSTTTRGNGTVFDSCRIIAPVQSGVYTYQPGTGTLRGDSVTVSNCYINGMKAHLPWGAVGGRQEHGHGIQFSTGFANTAYNNVVSGFPFGIENFNDTPSSVVGDTITSSDNYVGSNQFINNISSGIDALANNPAWGGRNIIYENNLVRNRPKMTPGDGANWTGVGILLTPPPYGPQWFIRNHVYGTGDIASFGAAGGVYIGGTGAENSTNIFYHNTIGGRGMSFYMSDTPNLSRVISRNNVWAAKKEGGDNVSSGFRIGSTDADTTALKLCDLDYDLIDTTSVNYGVARWGGTDGSFPVFQNASHQESHGIRANLLPVDSTRATAWPAAQRSTSPTVNAGVVIPGINTWLFGKKRFYGSAPDIGAYEYIESPGDSLNMPLNPNNRLWNRR